MQNRVLQNDFDVNTIIGKHINDLPANLEWETAYPIVDRETLLVTGIVDGNYPEEFNDGNWVTGALIDGKIVTGEHYCDFAVATD